MLHSILFNFADVVCKPSGGNFLAFPKWYKYLDGTLTTSSTGANACLPRLSSINDVWLVGAAVIEIMLRIAVLGAIGIVIWGGIKFVTSQGEPDRIASARTTIMDGIVGLVISVVATAVVTFVASRF